MGKDIHGGNTASTVFNDLDVLIEGLKQLLTSCSLYFIVTAEHHKKHEQACEKETGNDKEKSRSNIVFQDEAHYKEPEVAGSQLRIEGTIGEPGSLKSYDITVLFF